MKRMMALIMATVMLVCMAGCAGGGAATGSSATDSAGTNPSTHPMETPPPTDHRDPSASQGDPNTLTLGRTGQIRVTYTINVSSVRYITSPEQLPAYDDLKMFDEAYFQEKALIIVFETVNSGTTQVDIETVTLNGGTASVRLTHKNVGGVSTGDMATWLVWAEVDKDLDYNWVVENPAVKSDASEY